MGSNLSIEFVAQDNHILELIRYRVLFRITAVPDLGLVEETEARSLNDPGRSAEGIGSEENSCPENSLEGGQQTSIFLPAFVHPERLQHLGRSSKANGLTLLSHGKSCQVYRHDAVLSEREAIVGIPVTCSTKLPFRRSYTISPFDGFRTGNPHRTNGRELNATFSFPSARFSRTARLPSACRSMCFEITSSGAIRFRADPADSMPPAPA